MCVVIGGIDEAGRGPVVGPMVIAVVVGDGEALRRLGVRDSKRLSPAARRRLFDEVLKAADCVNYVVVEPQVVDLYIQRGGLNALELDFTARLVEACPAGRAPPISTTWIRQTSSRSGTGRRCRF